MRAAWRSTARSATRSPRAAIAASRSAASRRSGELDLGLDLDGDVERQRRHADRRARVSAALRPVELEDELAEAVDYPGGLIEARRHVDHAENAEPVGDAVEIAERALQVSENRDADQLRRL